MNIIPTAKGERSANQLRRKGAVQAEQNCSPGKGIGSSPVVFVTHDSYPCLFFLENLGI